MPGLCRSHSRSNIVFRPHLDVRPRLFRNLLLHPVPPPQISNPLHPSQVAPPLKCPFPSSLDSLPLQQTPHRLRQSFPTLLLFRQLLPALRRQPVIPCPPIVLRCPPLRADPPVLLHPVQRRVQRSFLHPQRILGYPLYVHGDPVPMHRPPRQRLQHQQPQRPLQHIILRLIHFSFSQALISRHSYSYLYVSTLAMSTLFHSIWPKWLSHSLPESSSSIHINSPFYDP